MRLEWAAETCGLQSFREGCIAFSVGWILPFSALLRSSCHPSSCRSILSSLLTQFVFHLCLGNVTTSTSVSQMASGISLVSFNSRPDGMHQRSYSVSSADQWSEATVIANSGISSGKKLGAGGVTCFGVKREFGILWLKWKYNQMLFAQIFCWKPNFQHPREKGGIAWENRLIQYFCSGKN